MTDKLFGAVITATEGHVSIETDWQEVARINRERSQTRPEYGRANECRAKLPAHLYPKKEVMHYSSIVIRLSNNTLVELVAASDGYGATWIEIN
jgi:hypothetical protein